MGDGVIFLLVIELYSEAQRHYFVDFKSVIDNFDRGNKFSVGLFLGGNCFSQGFFTCIKSFIKR